MIKAERFAGLALLLVGGSMMMVSQMIPKSIGAWTLPIGSALFLTPLIASLLVVLKHTGKGKDHACNGNKKTKKSDGSTEHRCSICGELKMTTK